MDLRHFDRDFALTNRLRTRAPTISFRPGAQRGVSRFVAQSYTSWPYARVGGMIKHED